MDDTLPLMSAASLAERLWCRGAPLVIDVRRASDFDADPRLVPGALRASPEIDTGALPALPDATPVIVYCAHGRAVSQSACARLRAAGIDARYLEGGYTAWSVLGLPSTAFRDPLGLSPSRWITRERPKIDRIACPWLIRRFIDPRAEFFYVPTAVVREEARRLGAEPYDIPDVRFTHEGERCSFDAVLHHFDLQAPGLDKLATIVRGADTARLDLAPQSSGLLAISLGLSGLHADDRTMLDEGLKVYDALYAWCRSTGAETHDWNPQAMAVRA